MANTNKKENFENFKKIQRGNLIVIPGDDIREHIKILLGPPDLTGTEVAVSKDETSKLESSLATNSKNPYVRARAEVLSKMIKSKRIEIEERERTGKTDARIYDEFVKEVQRLGDKYSNEMKKPLDKLPPGTDNVGNN